MARHVFVFDASELTRLETNIRPKPAKPIAAAIGESTSSTPKAVATPLPPLRFSHGE